MEKDRENTNQGLPEEILRQLKRPPRLEVPAFDAAWLQTEPQHKFKDDSGAGKILSFPGNAILSAAAAVLLAVGVFFAYPFDGGQGPESLEIFGSATGAGISLQGATTDDGWNLGVLKPGNTIRTGDQSLDMMASNGVILRIYPSSTVKIEESQGQLHLRQEQGTLLAEVLKKEGGKAELPRLKISTPHTDVLVTGTIFQVTVTEDETELYLDQGTLSMAETRIPPGNVARKGTDSALEVSPPALTPETATELDELRNSTDLLARKWIPEMKRLDQVREEKEISQMYGQSLEKIILKDGRILQGVVAAQEGDRLMLHTTSGVVVVRRSNVQEIVYEN